MTGQGSLFAPAELAAAPPPPGSWGATVILGWRQRMAKTGGRRGFFAAPGTGPDGERCQTCRHAVQQSQANTWWKCLRMRGVWTGGPATDICITAPACSGWEQKIETTAGAAG